MIGLITLSGEASRPSIELKLQSWYFIFLVIQVFLVTTITSAASAGMIHMFIAFPFMSFTDISQPPHRYSFTAHDTSHCH